MTEPVVSITQRAREAVLQADPVETAKTDRSEESLDEYFDRLDVAFAARAQTPPRPFPHHPTYLEPMLTTTLGKVMMGGAVVGMILGSLWMKKLVQVEV